MWNSETNADGSITWEARSLPVDGTLYDVADARAGPCAVGDGGVVVGRSADGSWSIVVENGPAARGETLHAADTTDDGARVWFGGSGGAVGCYDVPTGDRIDHSAPAGMEGTFSALTVSGERGTEKLLLADGNGVVRPGVVSGHDVDWRRPTTPADGNAITGLASDADRRGYGVDGNANVWQTTAEGWERVGVDDAENSLYAAAAGGSTVVVGGGNGRLYERDRTGRWTPYSLGESTIRCLAVAENVHLAGGESGFVGFRGRDGWRETDWDGSATIHGVLVGPPTVAVGSNGVVLERTEN